MESRELAKIAYNALDEKKGINISIIDISEISTLADYFIIAGGNNENQVKALANSVEEEMYKVDCKPKHIEGFDNANWILMDFSDIIVHVFNEEDRLFYDLEKIIFCADYIEPGRIVQPNLEYLRSISLQNLDLLTYSILKDTLDYLKSKNQIIEK